MRAPDVPNSNTTILSQSTTDGHEGETPGCGPAARVVTTFIVGIISSFKDRSVIVWATTLAGVVILLLMLGNLFFPHQTPF